MTTTAQCRHHRVRGDVGRLICAELTQKLQNVPNPVAVLTYVAGDPAHHGVPPAPFGVMTYTAVYDSLVLELAVLAVTLPASMRGVPCPQAWREGKEKRVEVKVEDVVFVGVGKEVQ